MIRDCPLWKVTYTKQFHSSSGMKEYKNAPEQVTVFMTGPTVYGLHEIIHAIHRRMLTNQEEFIKLDHLELMGLHAFIVMAEDIIV